MKWLIDTCNIILVSFEIKFIRREQKQFRNDEACRASLTCFWLSLKTLYPKTLTWFSIYHASFQDFKASRAPKKYKVNAVLSKLADIENAL